MMSTEITQEKHQLYGRKHELEQLQYIVESRCSWSCCVRDRNDTQTTTNYNNNGEPIFQHSVTNHSRIGISHECAINRDNNNHNTNHDITISSPLVLIHGPSGSGKKSFAYEALQNISGCISETTSRYGTVENEQIGVFDYTNISSNQPFLLVSGQYRPPTGHVTNDTQMPNTKQQMVDDRPFAAFDEAIVCIVSIISKNDAMMYAIRDKLITTIASPSEIDVLITAFPCMRKWLSNNHTLPSIQENTNSKRMLEMPLEQPSPEDSYLNFTRALHGINLMEQQICVRRPAMIHFLQSVVSVISVTIVLADLHLADAASISLMEALMILHENKTSTKSKQIQRLHIVATYNTDDIGSKLNRLLSLVTSCHLTCTCSQECKLCQFNGGHAINQLQDKNGARIMPTVNAIQLSKLKWDDVNCWIQTGTKFQMCTVEQQKHISDLVYHHSDGNPLRAQYIILYLEGESFLNEINKMPIPRSLGELFTNILLRQSNSVQDIIKIAAALLHAGSDGVNLDILDIATDQQCIDIIVKAEELKLLQFKHATNTVTFKRHEFQEAAYEMIPISERPLFHLDIGRRLWRNAILCQGELPTANDDNSTKVLLATSHLRNSIALLADVNERIYMSQLCYETGHRLSAVGDYVNAAKIFDFAICVLGTEIWRDDTYEASLALHNAAAQAYCYSGDIALMEKVLDAIFRYARTFHDQVPAYVGFIYAQGIRHQLVDLVQTVSFVLKELGEPLNQNPTRFDLMINMMRTQWILDRKSDRFILNLPNAELEKYKFVMQLLSFAMHFLFVKSPEMCFVICCRMIYLSIKQGITAPSVAALSIYGCFLSGSGNFDKGYRFGQLAIRLVEKFDAWLPRTYLYMYSYTSHWIHPIRDCLEPLSRAMQTSYKCGDVEMYGLLLSAKIVVMLFGGLPLKEVKTVCQTSCQSFAALGCTTPLLATIPIFDILCQLSGDDKPIIIAHDIKDADAAFKYSMKEGDKFCTSRWYMHRTMLLFLTDEYSKAHEMAEKSVKQSPMAGFILPFYHGLSALAIAWTCKPNLRRKFLRDGNKKARILKDWSKRCPANFQNKYLLLVAEISGLKGKVKNALDFYDRSIEAATIEGFSLEKAIAFERLGRYHLCLANTFDAEKNLLNAQTEYENWGSKLLSQKIDDLLSSIK